MNRKSQTIREGWVGYPGRDSTTEEPMSPEESAIEEPQVFTLQLDFHPGAPEPSRLFRAVGDLISGMQEADRILMKGFSIELKAELFLEDVQAGSLLVTLAQRVLKFADKVPDEVIASGDRKKYLGFAMLKGKHRLAKFVADHEKVSSIQELKTLQAELVEDAKAADMSLLPTYHPPSSRELLLALQAMSVGLEPLKEGEHVVIEVPGLPAVELNREFRVTDADLRSLLVREAIEHPPATLILKLRSPDFLGEKQWEFRHGHQSFKAKLRDEAWINRFHLRQVDIRPGDSLRAKVVTTIEYGSDSEVIHEGHEILEVLEVIPGPPPEPGPWIE